MLNVEKFKMKKRDDGKVVLKIGDMFGYNPNQYPITEFICIGEKQLVVTLQFAYNMKSDYYYVNDTKYAREDILLPSDVEAADDEFEPITKDNIAKVLVYNEIDNSVYNIDKDFIYCRTFPKTGNAFYFDNPLWLQLVEIYFGKLKPLPKFNFKDYLLYNRWTLEYNSQFISHNGIWVNLEGQSLCDFRNIKLNKANAERLVAMAKIEAELEAQDE